MVSWLRKFGLIKPKGKTVKLRGQPDGSITVFRLDNKRVEHHGFGTFYWHLTRDEVDCDEAAHQILRTCIGREYSSLGDLFGLSILNNTQGIPIKHRGFYLDYGYRGKKLNVPGPDIQIDLDSYEMLFGGAHAKA